MLLVITSSLICNISGDFVDVVFQWLRHLRDNGNPHFSNDRCAIEETDMTCASLRALPRKIVDKLFYTQSDMVRNIEQLSGVDIARVREKWLDESVAGKVALEHGLRLYILNNP